MLFWILAKTAKRHKDTQQTNRKTTHRTGNMNNDPRQNVILTGVPTNEPESLNSLAETGPFVEVTSEDAPGFAEHVVVQSPPRTMGCSHRSGKDSDHGAPHFGDLHHLHDERLLIPCPIGRTAFEFERCRQMLKHAIKHCLKLEFAYIVSAISCILNSLRPLHAREVDTATSLFVEYADSKQSSHDEDQLTGKAWFDRCESLLVVDNAGIVRFASGFMPQFLRQFRIRGIDTTHQTIATACLIQIDLDEAAENHPLAASMPCLPVDPHLVFSGYAEKYWRKHCRNAEQSCQHLSAAACVVPDPDRSVTSRDTARGPAANASADLDTILEHLTLDDGWEFV